MARSFRARNKRSGSKRRRQSGGQAAPATPPTPTTAYLTPEGSIEKLMALPGAAALLTTKAPSLSAWKPVGTSEAKVLLNNSPIRVNLSPISTTTPNGTFFGNTGLGQTTNGRMDDINGSVTWQVNSTHDKIMTGATDTTPPTPSEQQPHQFYITDKLSDGTSLANALIALNTGFVKSTPPASLARDLNGFDVYTVPNERKQIVLLRISSVQGSECTFQVSKFMINTSKNSVIIEWKPPASSTKAKYVGPIHVAASKGAATRDAFTVSLALCDVGSDGFGVVPKPPPAAVATIMK